MLNFWTKIKAISLLTLIILNVIFNFIQGDGLLAINSIPEWIENMDEEDISFVRKFILASGSLKEVAGIYGVTYPTVRLRLDRLIQKIQISEDAANEPYISLIKRMAINEKIDFDTAKILITEYKKHVKE